MKLPNAPRVLYVIGLAGVGKTYVGKLISEFADYYLYEADETLPADMREAVERNEEWTEVQLDNYYSAIRENILKLINIHPKVVVTQATYFQKYRDLMLETIPDIEFLWVKADYETNIKRIIERDDYVSVEYFDKSSVYFEPSEIETKIIVNNGDKAEIIRQLVDFYGD